jgi:magnesium transporter
MSGLAGELVVASVPRATPDEPAQDVRAKLVGAAYASATEVALLNDGELVGVVPVERLLDAAEQTPVGQLADEPVTVGQGEDLEIATRRAARAGTRSVAVVDDEGAFVGFVPPERLLRVLELEHDEDMARLGGFMSRASVARTASEEAVPRRLWHRLPWLVIGLAGAMASAVLVGRFEDELQRYVLLALFIPAVVYMADAVGTQTETLVIRGMSAGVPVRDVVLRELLTGGVVGVLLGSVFFAFAVAMWDDTDIAATVGIALGVSCSIATVVAMVLPYALDALGHDPAFGSGPLATVIQDLLSIVAYFAVASLIVF